VLILQVIEEPEAFGGKVFTDDCHPEIASVLASVFVGQAEAVKASFVCSAAGFSEQVFPFFAWGAAGVPVGSGVLTAVIEEAFVVVLGLERLDFTVDKGIQVDEVLAEALGDVEVHCSYKVGVKCTVVSRYSNVFGLSKVLMINEYI
jgi:hypothetical protein